ncbi:MAG: glycosyltransferase family 2 protein [Candidatus Helarchaeota archaeon]
MDKNISVIITSFNRLHLFTQTSHAIVKQLTPKDQIIVVEEGQEMGWVNYLPSLAIPYKFCFTQNTHYRSCSKAKNVAVRLADNEIIVINEPEVLQLDDCITRLKKELEKNPRQFAVPGTLYNDTGLHGNPTRMENSQAPFVAMVYKKELEAVGGWDERFKYWGNDDNDLMHRLTLNGCEHKVYSQLQIHHRWHERPPKHALGDYNESLLYEKNKSIVANKGKRWGRILKRYLIVEG